MAKKDNFRILLCEGVSDLVFLSLYICKKYGFRYEKDVFNLTDINQHASRYEKDDIKLYICAVGGKTRFNDFFEKHILPIIMNLNDSFKIAFLTDYDADFDKSLIEPKNLELKCGKWLDGSIIGDFANEIAYKSLLKVIPESQFGALETLLINAENNRDPDLVASVEEYLKSLSSTLKERYLKTARINLIIKVGIIMCMLDPEKTFSNLSTRFQSLNLESDEMSDNFSFIEELLSL